ncbi:MAG: lipid IV(A) 3-deoxy-D-manno-octulosonic acid transferase [Gammaproteobacteria bacterium]|nr:lipid IV(A) 3-deoxy-D-manno-octulosonic acid transferase [Gammaproteobacteria bacterium]
MGRPAPAERLYTALVGAAVPLVLLNLLRRGLRNRAYWRRWPERFGFAPGPADCPVWVHAVSVGEVLAAVPLIRLILERYPGLRVLVTTTTPTGSDRVRAALDDLVQHVYAPYDLPGAVSRFLDRVRPGLAVFMETELWPNTLRLCTKRGVRVMVANARLSERSARGYARFPGVVGPMLARLDAVAAQARADAERFVALGVRPDRVRVTGSLKFDVTLPASLREQAEALRRQWGADRRVWVAASTHDGEEERVLDAFSRVRSLCPDSLLVLVPRHPERFGRVLALVRRRGLRVAQRSRPGERVLEVEVLLGDTMGELPLFYAAADVAFVGGSLVPTGGHNLLEPAALGVPVVFGPHVFNFAEVSQLLLGRGAARQVRGTRELAAAVSALLQDPEARAAMGECGRDVVAENRGALDRLMAVLEPHLERLRGP